MTNHERLKLYSTKQFAEYITMLDIVKEVKDVNISMGMLKLPKYQKIIEEIKLWLESEVDENGN